MVFFIMAFFTTACLPEMCFKECVSKTDNPDRWHEIPANINLHIGAPGSELYIRFKIFC